MTARPTAHLAMLACMLLAGAVMYRRARAARS